MISSAVAQQQGKKKIPEMDVRAQRRRWILITMKGTGKVIRIYEQIYTQGKKHL